MREFVVFDIETTGLSRHYHKITEIGAIKVKDGRIVDEYTVLINPEMSIPRFITKLTGITNEMVKDEPTIKDVLPGFLEFIGDLPVVGHNVSFDYGFIEHNAFLHDLRFSNSKICTKKLTTRLLPNIANKKLGTICEHFNIVNSQAHRALSDVYATYEVLKKYMDMLEDNDVTCSLSQFESFPVAKCKRIMGLE